MLSRAGSAGETSGQGEDLELTAASDDATPTKENKVSYPPPPPTHTHTHTHLPPLNPFPSFFSSPLLQSPPQPMTTQTVMPPTVMLQSLTRTSLPPPLPLSHWKPPNLPSSPVTPPPTHSVRYVAASSPAMPLSCMLPAVVMWSLEQLQLEDC